jgi:hypothetical protein
VRFCRARSLLADQVFNSLTEAFQLKDEADETRPAKLRERLFGAKKNKQPQQSVTTPELKISLVTTPTNKFLTRILGRSSSVENLSSNPVNLAAMPRHLSAVIDSEFTSNLRAKSLSTSEICHPMGSRPLSPSPSVTRIGNGFLDAPPALGSKRPASYHGSCESVDSDFSDNVQQQDDLLYYCPCEQDCPGLIKALEVLQHVQEYHEGPLVRYFKPRLSLTLPLAFEDTAVVAVSCGGNLFFLKVVHQSPEKDTQVWLWMLGSKQDADNYDLILNLKSRDDHTRELNFRSRALSLSSTSWTQICKTRGGICVTASSLIQNFAKELETGIPIKMEAEVKGRRHGQCLP